MKILIENKGEVLKTLYDFIVEHKILDTVYGDDKKLILKSDDEYTVKLIINKYFSLLTQNG